MVTATIAALPSGDFGFVLTLWKQAAQLSKSKGKNQKVQ
jgi:hypothetical protein